MVKSDYQQGWRRMLVDMEIPAWDERFLSEYDPIAMADLYLRARATAVMFVCKTLNGWCFWPTRVGEMHPRLEGRDVVGETIAALRERDIAACAYYSVIFDNHPAERHPDWQVTPRRVSFKQEFDGPEQRHGLCCPNSPGYRAYVADQIADLYGRYEFGASFCDMTFWPTVCRCDSCRTRYREEEGAEIPETVDWTSPQWCAFQAARERWIDDFTRHVSDAMRAQQPEISVYHNFALGPVHWICGVPFSVTEHCDFLGGDLYGDDVEQLVVMKLMHSLSRSRPAEFMTFATTDATEHIRLKSREQLRAQVTAAAAESTAFMYIEAIDPVGTAADDTYGLVGEAYEALVPFEAELGGEPLEDVGVYFSDASKMSFAENGQRWDDFSPELDYPHLRALRGACRALQRAHVPFGVITRRQLPELDRFRVLVLPDVQRMDADEVAAVRAYVERGGRVYASRYTSLVETRGVRHDDFMLADVLGVHLEAEEPSGVVYAKPEGPATTGWLHPQRLLTVEPGAGALAGGLLRLRAAPEATALATLTLPYAHPRVGSFDDRDWASIHSFPPERDTGEPFVVEHRLGAGRAIYSAAAIEAQGDDASERLFAALVVERLLGADAAIRCDAHPTVWLSAFREPGDALRIALRNGPPAVVTPARLRVRPPAGRCWVALEQLPSGAALPFELDDGTLRCELAQVPELTMLRARHAAA